MIRTEGDSAHFLNLRATARITAPDGENDCLLSWLLMMNR
jgi:hypothetical protein